MSLNNKGVLLLDSGRYQDAARCFARASKITTSTMSIARQARRIETLRLEAKTNDASTQDVEEPSKCSTPTWSNTVSESPPLLSRHTLSYAEPPRKRPRWNLEATTTTLYAPRPPVKHTLGRPLWIKSQRKVALDPLSFSATLMYIQSSSSVSRDGHSKRAAKTNAQKGSGSMF